MKFLLTALAAAASLGQPTHRVRPRNRGFALSTINVGRNNQRYPKKDVMVQNNYTSSLAQGQVVLLAWTPDGSLTLTDVAAGANALGIGTRQKGVVLLPVGIAAGAIGPVRVQGPVMALVATTVSFSPGDSFTILDTGTATGFSLKAMTAQATTSALTVAKSIAFADTSNPVTTTSGATLVSVIFDGTDVNASILNG